MNWKSYYAAMRRSVTKYPYFEGNFEYDTLENSKIAKRLPLSRVGWGRRAIEMRANKTHFDKFENDTLGLNETFEELRVRQAFDKIKSDIGVCGVGFLALSGDRVMPFTALEATGTYDWREQNLSEGIAVFRERTKKDTADQQPDAYVYYTSDKTVTCEDGIETEAINRTGRPLMTVLTHQATTKQPFGRSVLSTPVRNSIGDASRITRQAMIAAYHYNNKVDVILGADKESEVTTVQRETGDALIVGPNENGQIPTVGQFAQHAMAPFNDSILMCARNFCADTKLSLSNLAISSTGAPQSPEELEIVGDDLRDDIVEWQQEMGEQLKHFAVTLWMHKNNISSIDANLQEKIDATTLVWKPIFRADVSKFGDGLNKMAQNAPAIVRQRSVWRKLGLTSSEIDDVIASIPTE